MMEGEGNGSAVAPCLIYADASAKLFGGVLHLPEALGNGTVEIIARISDPDHGTVAVCDGFDGDTFLPRRMDDPVEQVPQYVSEHMLVDAEFQPTVNFIYDEASAIDGQGEEADDKGIDRAMQTDLLIATVQRIHILDFTLK